MTPPLDKVQAEIATVDQFRELGYEYIDGTVNAPNGDASRQVRWGHDLVCTFLKAKDIAGEVSS
ncbi:MAG: hypothetical protein RBS80_13585 [Thermoguttaceae bacterium]|jgi:hypothetical protein|nr:hypothetical protein [Thermoguttaceae bacterium]